MALQKQFATCCACCGVYLAVLANDMELQMPVDRQCWGTRCCTALACGTTLLQALLVYRKRLFALCCTLAAKTTAAFDPRRHRIVSQDARFAACFDWMVSFALPSC